MSLVIHNTKSASVCWVDGLDLVEYLVCEGACHGSVHVEYGSLHYEDDLDGRKGSHDEAELFAPNYISDFVIRSFISFAVRYLSLLVYPCGERTGVDGDTLNKMQALWKAIFGSIVYGGISVLAMLKNIVVDE